MAHDRFVCLAVANGDASEAPPLVVLGHLEELLEDNQDEYLEHLECVEVHGIYALEGVSPEVMEHLAGALAQRYAEDVAVFNVTTVELQDFFAENFEDVFYPLTRADVAGRMRSWEDLDEDVRRALEATT